MDATQAPIEREEDAPVYTLAQERLHGFWLQLGGLWGEQRFKEAIDIARKLRTDIADGTQFYDEALEILLDRVLQSPPIGTKQNELEKTLRDVLDGCEPTPLEQLASAPGPLDRTVNGTPADEPPLPKGPEDYGLQAIDDPPPPKIEPVRFLTIAEWAARDLLEPDTLMGHLLSTTSRVQFAARTGLGKTLFLFAFGMAVAAGRDFLHWKAKRPCRVLYVDGEMSRRLLRKRVIEEADRLGCDPPEGFHALSHEDIEGFAPLNTPVGQACIERVLEQIGGVELVIFDSVMCLIAGDMKDEESWGQTLPWIRSLTRRGIGQIWAHHTGHDETRGYGSSTREWQLDTVMVAQQAPRDDTDVSFSLEFTKARERTPDTRADFQPVTIALVNNEWQCDLVETRRAGHVSPLGLRFLDSLVNVLASDSATQHLGRKSASTAVWRAECQVMGLIDPETKPDSARNLFNKHRRELIAANRIACDGDLSWTI